LITPHPLYWALGNTPFAREAAYAELVNDAGGSTETRVALTQSTLHGWALGDPDFVADLQKKTKRRVSKATAGRPAASIKQSTR
jgi:putative transposase